MNADTLAQLTAAMKAAGENNSHDHIYICLHEEARDQLIDECLKLDINPDADLTDDEQEKLTLAFKDAFWSLNTPTNLHTFGQRVLEILAAEPDWNSGTLDDISAAAYDLKLAVNDEEGMFAVIQTDS